MGRSVLVVGSGGREHALCLSLSISESIDTIHATPGTAGTHHFGTNHNVSASDIDGLVELAKRLAVDYVVVGPEAPLCDGLADRLLLSNIPCFGPQQVHAELEGSKLFAKKAMDAAGVPTAEYDVLNASSNINACLDIRSGDPWVIKRDVLAGGKGVVVTSDRNEAIEFIEQSIETDGHVLLERFLPGEEASMLVVMDKSGYVCLPPSQDHKRAYDGDEGPNTGGMGAYCPAPVVTQAIHQKTVERIVEPMHSHLSAMDIPYRGVLYVGLMIDENGDPYVVEFNVRFGDPECQVLMMRLGAQAFDLIEATARGRLAGAQVNWADDHALSIVMATKGYPGNYVKGSVINGLDHLPETSKSMCFHAGTTQTETAITATGGRVLNITARAESLRAAREAAYSAAEQVDWPEGFFRTDIGWRAL